MVTFDLGYSAVLFLQHLQGPKFKFSFSKLAKFQFWPILRGHNSNFDEIQAFKIATRYNFVSLKFD